ncbi:MAG: CRISPR-associated endonuclease Cas2 [Chloroflexi bacterium]|nr:CRISPR-associated endonuclease Cas2 [Chloroflexota bacterium]
MQFWVVVYDISDDRRRTKLHKALLDYGTPVQYSVFECWLTAEQVKAMRARVKKVIRPRKDHVRFYFLCAACAARVETTRAGEVTKVEEVIVV